MGCDLVVALRPATTDGQTLFGQNSHRPAREGQALVRIPGRAFAWGEKIRTQLLELPQARQTFTVLGSQPHGRWGYLAGVNEVGLAAGCAVLKTRLAIRGPTLLGTDLVRLALERCAGARQAVDLVTALVERHGQGPGPEQPAEAEGDHAFLIADRREAFALETSGRYWVAQEVRAVRAVSDVCVVRQDWSRIAPGLAAHAIERGWWPADGTKLDFAGALATAATGLDGGMRRWGRATLLLEEQSGRLDPVSLRRLLGDHYDGMPDEADPLEPVADPVPLCRHAGPAGRGATAASLVAMLPADPAFRPRAWWAPGPPCVGVYLPIFWEGELPEPLGRAGAAPNPQSLWWRVRQLLAWAGGSRRLWEGVRERFGRLQGQLDQDAEAFAAEAVALRQGGGGAELPRQAGLFMQHAVEQFDKVLYQLEAGGPRLPAAAGSV
jgi:secernin